MSALLLLSLLLFSGSSLSYTLEELKNFFNRQGYVVDKLNGSVVIDLGKGKAFRGERFEVVKEGKELVHPVSGEVLGRVDQKVGEVEVQDVQEKFSTAELLSDQGVERGDKVKLSPGEICYVGSDEGYFKVSSLVGSLKKGEGCDYVVREFSTGYGVEFKGTALAFFERPAPQVIVKEETGKDTQKEPEGFKLKAELVISFPSLPVSADLCKFSEGGTHLAVLFEGRLVIYELLEDEVVEHSSVRLPAGYPVSLQCAEFKEGKETIVVNIVSGSNMSSAIVELVGNTPVVIKEGIPYFLAVLDRDRPKETFLGQSFDARDLWGGVVHLELSGDELIEKGEFKAPSGFRLDSAVAMGDFLLFTDDDGYLRLYRGEELLLSEEGFGGSYVSVELPGSYEDDEKYTFNVRHFTLSVGGKRYLGAIKNVRSPVYRFLNVTKFSEGELNIVLLKDSGAVSLKKVTGKKFEEAVQSVIAMGDKLFILTGRTGTLPLQNRGDLYEAYITPF